MENLQLICQSCAVLCCWPHVWSKRKWKTPIVFPIQILSFFLGIDDLIENSTTSFSTFKVRASVSRTTANTLISMSIWIMKDPFHKSNTFFTNLCAVYNAAAFPPCYFSYFDSTSITTDVLERPKLAQQTKNKILRLCKDDESVTTCWPIVFECGYARTKEDHSWMVRILHHEELDQTSFGCTRSSNQHT